MKRCLPFLFIFTSISYVAHAEQTTIVCEYDKFASVQKVDQVVELLQLTFVVDLDVSSAKILRKNSENEVQLYPSGGGFTFVEVTEDENILSTTVDVKGRSVHSRNTIIAGDLVPSQFYGSCNYK